MLFRFAACGEPLVAAMEALLRGPRPRNDVRGGAALAGPERGADEWVMPIVPGGFDEDSAQVSVAGLGDAALGAFRATRMFGRNEADKRHGARRGGEATRVAELRGNRERGEVVDAAKAAEALHPGAERLEIEEGLQLGLDVAESAQHLIDRSQVRPVRLIERGERPRLGAEPGIVALGPRLLRGGEPTAVPEQEFGEPMPSAEKIGADVFAAPEQIASGFFLLRRNVDGRQGPGSIQHGELAGIPAIRLDAITGSTRDQRRGDDIARDAATVEGAAELETARARFVATADRPLALQVLDEFHDRRIIRSQGMKRRRLMAGQEDRRHRRGGVLIERNQRSRLHGDRPPLYAALLRALAG